MGLKESKGTKSKVSRQELHNFFNLTTLSHPSDFNTREDLFLDIYNTLYQNTDGGRGRELIIYVDDDAAKSEANINKRLNKFKNSDDIIKALIDNRETAIKQGVYRGLNSSIDVKANMARGANYLDDIAKEYDTVTTIYVNTENMYTQVSRSTELWVLVHEIFHSVETKFNNNYDKERKTQINTLEYLLSLGFIDEIAVEFIYQMEDYYNQVSNNREYNIFDYMLDKLKNENPEMLYGILDIVYLLGPESLWEHVRHIQDSLLKEYPTLDTEGMKGIWF